MRMKRRLGDATHVAVRQEFMSCNESSARIAAAPLAKGPWVGESGKCPTHWMVIKQKNKNTHTEEEEAETLFVLQSRTKTVEEQQQPPN